MTGVFLQVRIDSVRLPGKALLPLENMTVIEHAMTALKKVEADIFSLLTDEASSEILRPYAEKCGFELFAGDKDDVLKRYADAAKYFKVDTIIRATGDNPLVSGKYAMKALLSHLKQNADFSCFTGLPLGTGVEVVREESLQHANITAEDPYEREHVNPYLYRREDSFFIHRISAPLRYSCPESRVTLDTEDDYRYLKELFNELYRGEPIELDTLVPWVKVHGRTFSPALRE